MQNDTPTPPNPTSNDGPQVPPAPILGGMKNIQPPSDHIVLDPLPEVKVASPTPTSDASQSTSPRNALPAYNPLLDAAEDQSQKAIRRQTIASIFILVIGLLVLISAGLSIYGLSQQTGGQGPSGFSYALYGVQAIFGIGLMFRKEAFRWLLLIFTVFFLILNIYLTTVTSTVLSVVTSDPGLSLLGLVADVSKFVMPVIVIIFLNLRSVRNAFN